MTWVLIIMTLKGVAGVHVTTQEFNSENQCRMAAIEWHTHVRDMMGDHAPYMVLKCVPKGNPA